MQPLFRVRKDPHVLFGQDDTMANRPKLASKVAECIAEWANIETMLGLFLGFLLHTKAKTALAMYMALENRAAQLRMLDSAAKAELQQHHYDIFTIVMEQFLRPLMKTRDKLAHWCWGHSPDLPNDLLLMQPDEALLAHYTLLHGTGLFDPAQIDDNKVFVITDDYLIRLLRDVRKAQNHIAQLIRSLDYEGSVLLRDVSALDRLSSVPEIRRGLARLAERRAKQTEAQTQLSPPEQSGKP